MQIDYGGERGKERDKLGVAREPEGEYAGQAGQLCSYRSALAGSRYQSSPSLPRRALDDPKQSPGRHAD